MKRYVQHISGQGEKWIVMMGSQIPDAEFWIVYYKPSSSGLLLYLPKSEYRLCEPPEEWEDITGECVWTNESYPEWYIKAANGDRMEAYMNTSGLYRVRKIDLTYEHCNHTHAFVIERRKP